MKKTIYPSRIKGSVAIPASKSHTIRAVLIASMAEGKSVLHFPLESQDTLAAVRACRALGASIKMEPEKWTIDGTGGQLGPPATPIDVGNSGTTLYLLAGIAAIADFPIRFTGDAQIQKRSAAPLLNSLQDLGVHIESTSGGYAPFTVQGPLQGGSTSIECPTSQYLSSLLLAAPLARNHTEIEVPLLYERPYVEMTLDWLNMQAINYSRTEYSKFSIPGQQLYKTFDERIPGDFSSATFFMVAAAITGSTIELDGLDMQDTQGDKEVVYLLEQMGCTVHRTALGIELQGPPRDIGLKGGSFDLNNIPDALPALSVAACFSKEKVELTNVPQARQKETDRIAVMNEELSKLGARIEEREDGLVIHGNGKLQGGLVDGHSDHRVIMALSIAALAAEALVSINDISATAVTFPDFFNNLEGIGGQVEIPEPQK